MDYRQLIDSMTPEVYRDLKRAVELGKWPDGRRLTPEQREHCLQAVIAWGQRNLPEGERVGYIDRGHKAGEVCDDPAPQPLSWRD
ncbi:YeaC family protein [Parahaliea mediterranea]|uniref:YeaC family protein n=1 Tax=Parahaliea mediterranea TaxID=651086 RepID=A0A939DGY3_9GAMM|nr:YeaC family protein [Parahaliea mediterranea]MBN7797991.1 YeaC family protein [Parahaliea mediterranea]